MKSHVGWWEAKRKRGKEDSRDKDQAQRAGKGHQRYQPTNKDVGAPHSERTHEQGIYSPRGDMKTTNKTMWRGNCNEIQVRRSTAQVRIINTIRRHGSKSLSRARSDEDTWSRRQYNASISLWIVHRTGFIHLPHSMTQSAKKSGERHERYVPGPDRISGLPPRYLSLQEQTLGADYSEADSENGTFKGSACFPAVFCLLFLWNYGTHTWLRKLFKLNSCPFLFHILFMDGSPTGLLEVSIRQQTLRKKKSLLEKNKQSG